jgi:single-strand DNA-binding protein
VASYNKVFLMGNLTRDPQVKHLPSQMVVVEFGLAVNRKYRTADGVDKEEVAFVDCTAFGRQAETISQYCTKGKPIFVEGRLKFDTWDDRSGGGKRSKLTVVVENFQFLGRAIEGNGGPGEVAGATGGEGPAPAPAASSTSARGRSSGGEQAKMFPNEDRKAWRGRGDRTDGDRTGRAPAPQGGGRGARQSVVGSAANAKAEAPFGDERHFDDADIPF